MPSRGTAPLALLVMGTRPEIVKLGPVYREFCRRGLRDRVRVLLTGQHKELATPFLQRFAIEPDCDLVLMTHNQSLTHIAVAVMEGMERFLSSEVPSWVVVQGDTTSAAAAAVAAHLGQSHVAHVEAGLRSGDIWSPYPEEFNRRAISAASSCHFAPTEGARLRLLAEGHPEATVEVTGNTGIDALLMAVEELGPEPPKDWEGKTILVTAHRRESHEEALGALCRALRRLVEGEPDVRVVYPVHPNPNVRRVVELELAGLERVDLRPPLDYLAFVAQMRACDFIITDSGGIQEEAPALGKPVLIFRDTTERPEAVEAGVARLVGTREEDLLAEALLLLRDPKHYKRMATGGSPFGDGHAAERIVTRLAMEDPHQGRRRAVR